MNEKPPLFSIAYNLFKNYLNSKGLGVVATQFVTKVLSHRLPQRITWGELILKEKLKDYPLKGKGVVVALLDTGIDFLHPDLISNIYDLSSVVTGEKSPMDFNGHGTMVAGVLAASNNSFGVVGLASQSKIYSIKVANYAGNTHHKWLAAGIHKALDNNVDIIATSISLTQDYTDVRKAIERAVLNNVLVVAAAGNIPSNAVNYIPEYPANYEGVLAVGAMDRDFKQTEFSAPSALIAPGVDLYTTYKGGSYTIGTGTSLAQPFVSGIAALIIAEFKLKATPYTILSVIDEVTKTLSVFSPDKDMSQGGLNLVVGFAK